LLRWSSPGSGEAVGHERVAEQVERLALVAEAVGASEPEGVVEVAVNALRIVTTPVEPGEVVRYWVSPTAQRGYP